MSDSIFDTEGSHDQVHIETLQNVTDWNQFNLVICFFRCLKMLESNVTACCC